MWTESENRLIEASRLREELNSSKEYKRIQKVRRFTSSQEIFRGNYRELESLFKKHNKINLFTISSTKEKRKDFRRIQNEIIRCLHNFISSSFSLLENSRSHYNSIYKKHNLIIEYEKEVKIRFENNPITTFIKDLRNFIQHYRFPSISTNTFVSVNNKSEYKTELIFRTKDLLDFKNWSKQSKDFIKINSKEIRIEVLLGNYYKQIYAFHNWFNNEQSKIFKEDYQIVNKKEYQIKKLAIPHFLEVFFNLRKIKNSDTLEEGLFRFFNTDEKTSIKTFPNDSYLRFEKIIKTIENYHKIDTAVRRRIEKLYHNLVTDPDT